MLRTLQSLEASRHPGTLTLSSGVGGVGGAIGVPSINSPDDLSGFQIDPKDFGIFGVRLYRSAAPLGLEHTVAYSPNFIDSDGNAFLFSTNLRVELPAPIFRPYATAGGGLVRAGGSGSSSFGTKFSFNYGGGLNLEVMAPVGLRFDCAHVLYTRCRGSYSECSRVQHRHLCWVLVMYRYLNDQIVMGISTTGRSGSIRGANLRTMVS